MVRAPIYSSVQRCWKDLQFWASNEQDGEAWKHGFLFQLVDVLRPGGVCVLTLQQSMELFELLHRLVFQVGVGDLQPNAVCRPRKLAWKHLGKDSCNNWNNLGKQKWQQKLSIRADAVFLVCENWHSNLCQVWQLLNYKTVVVLDVDWLIDPI